MVTIIGAGLLFSALLIYAAITDIKRREVDDWICILIIVVSLIGTGGSFGGAVITALPFFIPALFKGGIGGGDVKLMFACGAVLGVWGGVAQIIISLSLVAVFSVFLCIKKGFTACKKTAIPLAPFLCVGGIVSYIITHMGGFIF
ncbi:MAG: A24 family peptidase [Defluviitaleaceae bacterium]|nr:A24 family peptidase [Defluviitaleaceae bacterium]MCL2275168.1 A24 family peptidase [Defluviitaleaceae bacterium]